MEGLLTRACQRCRVGGTGAAPRTTLGVRPAVRRRVSGRRGEMPLPGPRWPQRGWSRPAPWFRGPRSAAREEGWAARGERKWRRVGNEGQDERRSSLFPCPSSSAASHPISFPPRPAHTISSLPHTISTHVHTLTVLSAEQVPRRYSTGWKCKPVTECVWPASSASSLFATRSQILTLGGGCGQGKKRVRESEDVRVRGGERCMQRQHRGGRAKGPVIPHLASRKETCYHPVS